MSHSIFSLAGPGPGPVWFGPITRHSKVDCIFWEKGRGACEEPLRIIAFALSRALDAKAPGRLNAFDLFPRRAAYPPGLLKPRRPF